MPGLATLIQGECYSIQGARDAAIESFKKCIEIRKNHTTSDLHINAFAEYALGILLIQREMVR